MPFKAGQSGNPGGRSRSEKQFRDALSVAIKRTDGNKTKLAQIAESLVQKAIAGDVAAINAVADRLDGKVAQVIAGDAEAPLATKIVVEFVGTQIGGVGH